MATIAEPSDELMGAICEAVEHGMEMIQGSGGPLRPFLMSWEGGARTLSNLMGDSMEDSVEMGRELARESGPKVDRCVLAWDGYVTIEGERSDALFFQAYERGATMSHVLVQRYEPSLVAHFRAVGNTALIEQEPPLFAGGSAGGEGSGSARMRNPFKRRSRANVHNLVVRDPTTGLDHVHFMITADDIGDAKDAIEEAFEAVVSGYRRNPDFGGEIVFAVYGSGVPGAGLPPELAEVQSLLEEKIASSSLKTTKGRALRVRVEHKQSAF